MIDGTKSQRERDLEAVKFAFPYFVTKQSPGRLDLEVLNWLAENVDDGYMLVDTYPIGPKINVPPWITTYAFKDVADAITFKLKFP